MTKRKVMAFSVIGILAVISVAFFAAEHFLADGWYYIPEKANVIASILCFIWACIVTGGLYFAISGMKNKIAKTVVAVAAVIIGFIVVIILVWNCILYHAGHMVKVEQYDEHIALYVENTFIRAENRHPCYRYEESWLLMRKLDEAELDNAIIKYGDPDNYYKKQI